MITQREVTMDDIWLRPPTIPLSRLLVIAPKEGRAPVAVKKEEKKLAAPCATSCKYCYIVSAQFILTELAGPP